MATTGRLTKDEVSDLQSFVNRLLQARIALENAQAAFDVATRKFNAHLWELEHKVQEPS